LGVDRTLAVRGVGTNVAIEQIRSRSFWSGAGHVGIATVVDFGARIGTGVSVATITTCGAEGVLVVAGVAVSWLDIEPVSEVMPDAAEYSGESPNCTMPMKNASARTRTAVDNIALMKVGVPW